MSWTLLRALGAATLMTFALSCAAQPTKGGGPNGNGGGEGPDASLVFNGDASFVFAGYDASLALSNGDGAEGSLEILPADPVLNVTI